MSRPLSKYPPDVKDFRAPRWYDRLRTPIWWWLCGAVMAWLYWKAPA